MSESFREIEPFRIVNKGEPLTPEETQDVIEHVNVSSRFNSFEQHLERFTSNEKRREIFFNIIDAQLRWIESNLDISVRKRFPNFEKILIFKKKFSSEGYRAALKEVMGRIVHENWGGSQYPGGEILLANPERTGITEEQIYSSLAHEMIHRLGYEERRVGDVVSPVDGSNTITVSGTSRGGYQNYGTKDGRSPKFFIGFNEFVTETLNLNALNFQKNELLTGDWVDKVEPGYVEGVLFLNRIFELMKERAPEKFDKYKKAIYQGYFTGEAKNLACFEEIFGKGVLKILSTLGPQPDVDNLAVILRDTFHDNPDIYLQTFNDWLSGQPITLVDGAIIKNLEKKDV